MLRHKCLVWDLVLVILDHVVGSTPVAEEAVLDDFDDEGSCILLTQTRVESLLEQFDGLSSEAGKASVQHEVNQGDNSIHVGPDSQVSSHAHLHEPLEGRRLHLAAHDHHHFIGKLYIRLPAEVPTGRTFKHEPKI